ncbi:MAG: ABC transporter ATP-binding protein [Ktedonobacterales bacterium]|nr:ABC transporter ATP-binding protein [Ktedonobacterales bacterium]
MSSPPSQDNIPAIQAINVKRVYQARGGRSIGGTKAGKTVTALDGVSLSVARGEIFGLLGRNGAGKTTLIKIFTTLLAPSGGQALIDGMDVTREVVKVRQRIAMVSGGEQSGYGILTVREQLWMFAQFYGVPSKVAHARIDELLAAVGMSEQANQKVYALSTGMRQRMNLCRALVSDPEVLFLDEPTVGLDVEASRAVRDYVRLWMSQDLRRTVLLTTHYMFEADELCNHVAVINHGQLVAEGTTADLKRGLQEHARFQLEMAEWAPAFTDMLRGRDGVVEALTEQHADRTQLRLALLREEFIMPTVASLNDAGARILTLRRIEPTLEEAFVRLVGDEAEAEAEGGH